MTRAHTDYFIIFQNIIVKYMKGWWKMYEINQYRKSNEIECNLSILRMIGYNN